MFNNFDISRHSIAKLLEGKPDKLRYTQIEILPERCYKSGVKMKVLYKDEDGVTLMSLSLPYITEGQAVTIANGFNLGIKISVNE